MPSVFCFPFAQVFVDPLTPEDLLYIAENKFPSLALKDCGGDGEESSSNKSLLSRMIAFNR